MNGDRIDCNFKASERCGVGAEHKEEMVEDRNISQVEDLNYDLPID